MLLGKVNMFLIFKGSCGKSTSVANLSSAIANQFPKKHKVLMIDLDPQADLSKIFNVAGNSENIHEVLLDKKTNSNQNKRKPFYNSKFRKSLFI